MRASLLLLASLTAACGSPPPTAPSPTPTPIPSPTPVPVVVANYAGSWAGTYTVTACDQAGDIAKAHWCEQLRAIPSPGLRLTVTQTSREVTATVGFGGDGGPLTGRIGDDNHLTLTGDYASNIDGAVILTTIGGWDTALSDPAHMTGHFAVSQRVASYSGNLYFEAALTTFTR